MIDSYFPMSNATPTFSVTPPENGQTLAAILKRRLALPWSSAKRLIEDRRVRVNGQTCTDVARRMQPGMTIAIQTESRKSKPARNPKSEIRNPKSEIRSPVLVYLDPHLVVVDKPPGVTTMRHADEAAEFGPRGKTYLP